MERPRLLRIDPSLLTALAPLQRALAPVGLTFLLVVGLLATAILAYARPRATVVRVDYLSDATLAVNGPLIKAFLQGMRELGYVEGQNLVVEYRFAEGSDDRLPSLAAELHQTRPDVILTSASAAAQAAKQATATIPIVMVAIANAVGQGLVATFAQPGGNVTGLSGQYEDLVRKMPQLLNDMVPKASRIAVLADGAIPASVGFLRATQTTAQALGVKLLPVEVRGPNDFDGAFSTVMNERPDALITLPSSLLYFQQKRIADFARAGGLPAIAVGRVCRSWRLDELWAQPSRVLPDSRNLRRQDSEGHQAGRSAGGAANPIRAGHQSEDREGAWLDHSPVRLDASGQGDRMRVEGGGPKA
jgi:putative ABC transport system substrate-binding protein